MNEALESNWASNQLLEEAYQIFLATIVERAICNRRQLTMNRYEAYKDSGVEWIGEIPAGWEVCRLKQHNAIAGRIGWQGLTSDEYCDEGPFLITGVNFVNGMIDWNSCTHITDERWQEAAQIQIVNDDLLITKDGTVGKVAFAKNLEGRASLNSGVMVIRPISACQNMRYLFWILHSEVFWGWFSDINSGNSTIIHLYQRDFLNFSYLLPPLAEQETIAVFLDTKTAEIDGLVADCEREVELLREYRKAVISEAVTKGLDPNVPVKDSGVEWIGEIPKGWEVDTLASIMSMITNGYVGPTRDLFVEEGVRYLQSLHIVNGAIDFDKHPYHVARDWSEAHSRSILKAGDVLVVQTGAIGNCAYVAEDYEGCNCHALIILRPNADSIIGKYLYYYLASNIGKEKMLLTRTGATHPHLNSTKIRFVDAVRPPLDEQRTIVAYLDAKTVEIDSLIDSKRQMAEKLREYRKSLISEAVTGKFKVPGV